MADFWRSLLDNIKGLNPASVLDILIIAVIIYWVLLALRGTTAMTLLRGIAVVAAIILLLGRVLNLTVVNWLVDHSLIGLLIAIPIIFQPEIRRALERVGRTRRWAWLGRPYHEDVLDTVITASLYLAQQRHGALIVLERETGLEDYIDTGIKMDAALSVELLAGIFYPNSPLHDGAALLRENRVVAAACTMPLSANSLPGYLGLRHRAALGITEHTDAVAVVVSEETGGISVAANGRLMPRLEEAPLRAVLTSLFRPSATDTAAGARWWQSTMRSR